MRDHAKLGAVTRTGKWVVSQPDRETAGPCPRSASLQPNSLQPK